MTGADLPHDRLLAMLCDPAVPPVLGVFGADAAQWDGRLASCCREVVAWPCQPRELQIRLRRMENAWRLQRQRHATREGVEQHGIVGNSPAMRCVLDRLRKIARCEAPVLIHGETGTGKEMAARLVHYLGPRRDFPFVPINCGAIPDDLVENELFGHRKGAFTGACEVQQGLVEQATSGTLFLDEVGTLSARAQVVLLRFLENQEYKQLGGFGIRTADVRIIAATNADLACMVEQGCFRQDLLFRLNILSVKLPPVRERREDIELLAHYFVDKYRVQYGQPEKRFHPETLQSFLNYDWPGNVREMENVIHQEFLLADGPEIRACIPDPVPPVALAEGCAVSTEEPFSHAKARVIARFEQEYLRRLLVQCQGNVTAAAQRAGKERRALGKLLKKHGIDPGRY
jgi:DNA-binding NtrC family response regulator